MRKLLWTGFAVLTACLYIGTVCLGNRMFQPSIASKILRFHVVANSDETIDQEVKIAVRDAVGAYMKPYLRDTLSLQETKEIVLAHLDEITKVTEAVLLGNGFSYQVKVGIVSTYFPEKTYGSYTFPSGEYEALQIVLGEGTGQNWWCVLYPNMCFRGTVYEVVEEDAKVALKEILTPWEYASVFESGKVDIRFKFLEFFAQNE